MKILWKDFEKIKEDLKRFKKIKKSSIHSGRPGTLVLVSLNLECLNDFRND